MKTLILSDLGLERLQSLLALTYRDMNHVFFHDPEIKALHQQVVSLSDDNAEYMEPNYPVPAIPLIHQWDFTLWYLLHSIPVMTDEEWDREEEEWQDYLDNLDN